MTTSDPSDRTFTLSVHPSVVFKLGEDLITDDVQALTELIKNAYDADSPGVDVRIDTRTWTELRSGDPLPDDDALKVLATRAGLRDVVDDPDATPKDRSNAQQELDSLPEPIRGRIEVLDAGTGMSVDDIERGWLTVSASRKREMKARGETTPGKRTPLGDKGLGRLGAQRLGRVLDLETRLKGEELGLSTSIVWADFEGVESLNLVPIRVRQVSVKFKQGTSIVVRGLSDPFLWTEDNPALDRKLADLISPYSDQLGFKIAFKIDGKDHDLRRLSAEILDNSAVTYRLAYNEGILDIEGEMRIEYLRPDAGQDKISIWNEIVGEDRGYAFLTWLLDKEPKKTASLNIRQGDDRRFCTFHASLTMAQIADVELDSSGDAVADPGPFNGRVDVIQRRNTAEVFSTKAQFNQWIDAVAGVRMYRNGFGIRLSTDWLKLASQWTKASSWYTIRPENVTGYINLTAADNAALEETSNREDIRDTATYRNFQRLLGGWLQVTEDFQSILRRGYLAYAKRHDEARQGVAEGSSAKELGDVAASQFRAMGAIGAALSNARTTLSEASSAISRAEGTRAEDQLVVAREALERLQRALDEVETLTSQAVDRRGAIDLLVARVEAAEQQIRDVWELVSLGITAETVSHEILNITDRLNGRSVQLAKYNDSELKNPRVGEYIEHVRGSARAMSAEVSHLDSSLRYVRDLRGDVDIAELVTESVDYFNNRWRNTTMRAAVVINQDFSVKTSKGKLSQVLDNLLLNSEYWASESARVKRTEDGFVKFEVNRPYLTVTDNGPGIDPSVEETLFDPFVTRKPKGRGRGLGLFVVQQLLDSERIDIALDAVRNELGNRFRFRLDFTRLLEGD